MEIQNKFEGWAIVELFGHQKIAGYVTTEYFGSGCLFRVEMPETQGREEVLEYTTYIDGELAPKGSVVCYAGIPETTKLVGLGAIYALNPCTHEDVMEERNREAAAMIDPVLVKRAEVLPVVDEEQTGSKS